MKMPWRSRVETASPEVIPPEPPGPVIDIYSSPGLEEALRGVPDDGSCRVLDLGPSVADNVEFVSSFASYLQIVDAIDRDPSASGLEGGGFGRLSGLQSLFEKHRRSFGLVLMWDVLNYLSIDRAERLLQSVAELCLPGARLHTIVFATDTMAAVPNRYRILYNARLAYESATTELRGAPDLPPAAVQKLLRGFRVEHSFVLQHGVHEYVATRKRWYIKE
jgi:hypothetical protein